MLIMKGFRNKQNGFTLIELMIAMLIGLIVVAATIAMYVITIKSSSDTMKSAQLNQDFGVAMTIMTNDIRRAGYWGGAITGSDSRTNPFNALNVYDFGGNVNACILYSYDADADGVIDTEEYFGFRINGATIEIKSTGSTVTNCAVDAAGTWSDILDSGTISVTSLSFNTDNFKCKNVSTGDIALCSDLPVPTAGDDIVELRYVVIGLDGEVTTDSSISASITSSVKVKNNRVYIQP